MIIDSVLPTQVVPLADGLAGIDQTIVAMTRLATAESATPAIREAAEAIIRHLPQRDYDAESRAIEAWVRNHIRYTRDGLRVETLKSPLRMLAEIERDGRTCADCDDCSILCAALLLSIGHSPAFQVLGYSDTPHHVNVVDNTTGVTLDATTGEAPDGASFGYRETYDVVPALGGLHGLGEAAEPSLIEKWLPFVLIGRMILKMLRRNK